ncbi:ABC transporter substrate-binding protein [Mycolicibacterium goodii]|uniref:ABC transporter substrate-binding protein n=1 Tax=Mycolicibacterium goodii TaxID=134601 RepID=UPI001BDDC735|nr:ABC transporter substrate-binding protein [Mycolicibacterium goodii]MBU8829759.1 ABC transporter substrate-binding protein [Mycolicibacterium goodii]
MSARSAAIRPMADRGERMTRRLRLSKPTIAEIRLLYLVCAAVLMLTACGTSSPAPSISVGEQVSVQAANGEVTVPVTDTGIWALDYQTALNLLAIGVVPEHAGRYDYDPDPFVSAAYTILREAGVELVEPGNAELIAAAAPELIVGTPAMGNEGIVPQLNDIAPVVLLPDLLVLEDDLDTLGAITGHQNAATAVVERLDAALRDLARKVTDSGLVGTSVSVLSACGEDAYCLYGNARGFGPILDDLGLERPATQAVKGNEWGYEFVSPETVDEQTAPIVVAFVGSVSLGAPSPFENPRFDTSDALAGEVDFSAWFGVGPLNYLWVLNDLDAILFGEGHIAQVGDGPSLWADVIAGTP